MFVARLSQAANEVRELYSIEPLYPTVCTVSVLCLHRKLQCLPLVPGTSIGKTVTVPFLTIVLFTSILKKKTTLIASESPDPPIIFLSIAKTASDYSFLSRLIVVHRNNATLYTNSFLILSSIVTQFVRLFKRSRLTSAVPLTSCSTPYYSKKIIKFLN